MSSSSLAASRPNRPVRLLALLVLLAVAAACHIVSVSGPTVGIVGQILGYEVVIDHDVAATLFDNTVWLMVEIPSAWSVAGASYSGDLGAGTPAQGPPTAKDPGGCFSDAPADGYQRVFFSAGPFAEINENDQGTLSVDLQTAGDPGDFELRFRAATEVDDEEGAFLNCMTEGMDPIPVTTSYPVSLTMPIPALGTWGAGLLVLLLAGLGLRRLAAA